MAENASTEAALSRYVAKSTDKAMLLHVSGFTNQAIEILNDLLVLDAENDEVLFNLAKLSIVTSNDTAALCLLSRVAEKSLHYAEALFLLGILHAEKRAFSEAADCYRRVLELDGSHVEAHNNLGLCLAEQMHLEKAMLHYNKVFELAPNRYETYINAGNLLVLCWKLAEAKEMYLKAIEIKHDYACAYSNLGRTASYEGRIDDAIQFFLKALEIQPDFRGAADNLLFVLNNSDRYTPEQIRNEHFRLSASYQISPVQRCSLAYNKKSRTRIGYVSSDFKSHSVGFFIEPVLSRHSKDEFEIYCYDNVISVPDETTERMKSYVDEWREISGLSDLEAAKLVAADNINILVDLSGYSKGNRLGIFALKPAPIQVTWLGYPNTTGLDQIAYRFTDSFADPPGMTEHLHSERLIRLPRSFLCYKPAASAPAVDDLPDYPVVFCSFNNYPKLSDTILALWARILHAAPDSSLMLKCGQFGDAGVRTRFISKFALLGIDSSRLVLSEYDNSLESHLHRYGSCHIALDTFPYNGTTTSCEALWMGVPVVTLAGKSHVSRVGVSILNNIGMPELVANSADQYVNIAVSLAEDKRRIKEYRTKMRDRLLGSHLLDAARFTADLERAYRQMLEHGEIEPG